MKNTTRLLLIYQFLYDKTDENNYVTIADINRFLRARELDGDRETIPSAIKELQELGYDIDVIRSTQNKYCLKSRKFTVPEVKMLIDAVQGLAVPLVPSLKDKQKAEFKQFIGDNIPRRKRLPV